MLDLKKLLGLFLLFSQGQLSSSSIAQVSMQEAKFNVVDNAAYCDSECAKKILQYSTIAIDTPGSSGSGVIIGIADEIYTAVTAAHVVQGFTPKEELYAVSYPTKKRYRITSVEFPSKGKHDIAIIRFKAQESLYIQPINFFFVAPPSEGLERTSWGIDGDGARASGISLPSGAVTVPIFRFNEFSTQVRAEGNKDGYEFIYNASTVPGMSGGPIVGWRETCFDKKIGYKAAGYFSLFAIHGRSEGYAEGGRSGLSLGVPLDLIKDELKLKATAYGIPSNDQEVNDVTRKQYCSALF